MAAKKPSAEEANVESTTDEAPKARSLADRAAAGERLTIEELAEVTGNRFAYRPTAELGGVSGEAHAFSLLHRSAAMLHGWEEHRRHTAEPLTLRLTDYQAALKAASAAPPGKQTLEPHTSACSPHRVKETQ